MVNVKEKINKGGPMKHKKRSGRPKKAEGDKVSYQRIAVYSEDYEKFVFEVNRRGGQLTDAFTEMVAKYCK